LKPTTRNQILEAMEEGVNNTDRVGEVVIGVISPDQATTKPKVMIWWERDVGERKDGDKMKRHLHVIVGVLFKIDPTDPQKQRTTLLEASAVYDEVHAAIEAMEQDSIGGLVMKMTEMPEGIEPRNFGMKDEVTFIGSSWDIEYQRNRRTT